MGFLYDIRVEHRRVVERQKQATPCLVEASDFVRNPVRVAAVEDDDIWPRRVDPLGNLGIDTLDALSRVPGIEDFHERFAIRDESLLQQARPRCLQRTIRTER